jgi:hypothetical protein
MGASLLSVPRLFGIGDPSPHSYYPCVIGCRDENYTPDKDNYYTPNQLDADGKPQSPIGNYYEDNFAERNSDGNIKMDNGKPVMTINMGLLPKNNQENTINNQIILDTTRSK